MTRPFLTIFTRCCKRPVMLTALIESILKQTDRDIEQIFVPDRAGGKHPEGPILWANNQIPKNAHRVDGQYVYFLDDDKLLIRYYDFIERLKAIAQEYSNPHVILVRSICATKEVGSVHLLPVVWDHSWPDVETPVNWEKGERPKKWAGHALNYVVRADYWKQKCGAYTGKKRGGDAHFGNALIRDKSAKIVRLDIIATLTMQRGKGLKFEECGPRWFERVVKRFGIENLGGEDWRLRLW
jgi:hypothetical protein